MQLHSVLEGTLETIWSKLSFCWWPAQGHTVTLMAELGLDQGFLSHACIFYMCPLSVLAPVVLGLVCWSVWCWKVRFALSELPHGRVRVPWGTASERSSSWASCLLSRWVYPGVWRAVLLALVSSVRCDIWLMGKPMLLMVGLPIIN